MSQDYFSEDAVWGRCQPSGWGGFWLAVARALPGGWPWSRLALGARRLSRATLRGPVDISLWGHRLRLFSDRSVSESRILFLPSSWDSAERELLGEWVESGFVFLDVGANAGAYSFWVASLLSKVERGGRVVAVEPDPLLARQLRFNVRTNEAEAVISVVEAAMGGSPGSGVLARDPVNSGKNRLLREGGVRVTGGCREMDEDTTTTSQLGSATAVTRLFQAKGATGASCATASVHPHETEGTIPTSVPEGGPDDAAPIAHSQTSDDDTTSAPALVPTATGIRPSPTDKEATTGQSSGATMPITSRPQSGSPTAIGAQQTREANPDRPRPESDATTTPTVPVQVKTLAEIVAELGLNRVDCLKLDVEGYESDVLTAFLSATPRRSWPTYLIVELKMTPDEAETSKDLTQWILAQGYRQRARTKLNGIFELKRNLLLIG